MSQRGGPYGYGQWHLPSGKRDAGEPLAEAAACELLEETGLFAEPETMTPLHTVIHHLGDGPDRIGLFYETTTFKGEVANREPDKCLRLEWFADQAAMTFPVVVLRAANGSTVPWQT
ncbi:NUDIX domain-containing protein [Actinomycetota bacterium Odt1-20B]